MAIGTSTIHKIETFGGLAVTGGALPPTGAATQRKPLLLLALLAASGDLGVGRERLLALLWPESDGDRARNALKQLVHALRRDLRDPEAIVGVHALRLNPLVVTSDVAEFRAAIEAGALEQAVALYRGPFLDGVAPDGAPELERYFEEERARLARLYMEALERLAVGAAAGGDHRAAAGWWRRLAAADPLSGRVAVGLMRALAAAGDAGAALQHARIHETLVRQELDAPPAPEVLALTEQLREAPADGARTSAGGSSASIAAPLPLPARLKTPVADGTPQRPTPRAALLLAVALAALTLGVGALIVRHPARPDQPAAPTVAVLPFANVGGDSADAYFSDGLSDELIAALARVEGLRVAARTSSFALRDARLGVRAIGDTLGVATLVEGSVRRERDRLRVTARLVDTRTGFQLWSHEYDRRTGDALAVQDEIAGAIAGAMRLRLIGAAPASAHRTGNAEAYDLYLRGEYLRNRLRPGDAAQAVAYYDRALLLDPGFVTALTGKAFALQALVYYRQVPRDSGVGAMRDAARRALALDEQSAAAHVAMGLVHFFHEWDWPAAGRELARAVALAPDDAFALSVQANYLRAMGRYEEAVAARQRALALDPLSLRITVAAGGDYLEADDWTRALQQFERAVDVDSMNPMLLGVGPRIVGGVGEVYERMGQHARAVDEYVRVAARRHATPAQLDALRAGYATGGMRGFWRAWLAFEEAQGTPGQSRALRLSAIWARIGDADRSAEWLERAYAERDPGLVYIAVEPAWRGVRTHPRIAAIIERMHFPETAR